MGQLLCRGRKKDKNKEEVVDVDEPVMQQEFTGQASLPMPAPAVEEQGQLTERVMSVLSAISEGSGTPPPVPPRMPRTTEQVDKVNNLYETESLSSSESDESDESDKSDESTSDDETQAAGLDTVSEISLVKEFSLTPLKKKEAGSVRKPKKKKTKEDLESLRANEDVLAFEKPKKKIVPGAVKIFPGRLKTFQEKLKVKENVIKQGKTKRKTQNQSKSKKKVKKRAEWVASKELSTETTESAPLGKVKTPIKSPRSKKQRKRSKVSNSKGLKPLSTFEETSTNSGASKNSRKKSKSSSKSKNRAKSGMKKTSLSPKVHKSGRKGRARKGVSNKKNQNEEVRRAISPQNTEGEDEKLYKDQGTGKKLSYQEMVQML